MPFQTDTEVGTQEDSLDLIDWLMTAILAVLLMALTAAIAGVFA